MKAAEGFSCPRTNSTARMDLRTSNTQSARVFESRGRRPEGDHGLDLVAVEEVDSEPGLSPTHRFLVERLNMFGTAGEIEALATREAAIDLQPPNAVLEREQCLPAGVVRSSRKLPPTATLKFHH